MTPFPELDHEGINGWNGAESVMVKRPTTLFDCLWAVEVATGVGAEKIKGPRRYREYVWPRFMVCALALKHTRLSSTTIGWHLGRRDHTSILNGRDKAQIYREQYPKFDSQYMEAEALL